MTVASVCAELTQLAPMLDGALLRDNTGTQPARSYQPLSLFNADVLQARITLAAEIPAAAIRCGEILNEYWVRRDIRVSLRALPRFADLMLNRQLVNEHAQLEALCRHWLRLVSAGG